MLAMRFNMCAAGFNFNFRNIIVQEWMVFLVFACFRELAAGLSVPDDPPKFFSEHSTAPPPPLIFPESGEQGFRVANGLESAHKPVHSPPILNPLSEILRSAGSGDEASFNKTLAHFNMLSRLTNLTGLPEPRRQNFTVDSSFSRSSSSTRLTASRVDPVEAESNPATPELSAKIKASLAKEEDELIVEPTKSAAGFVIVVVVVSVMSYLALFVWRKLLEQRYGNREMLIDEDQFCHASNLYDFQLGSEQEMS